MTDSAFILIVAAVFFSMAVVTIKRGWFPFPFFRVYREKAAPIFWLIVAVLTATGALAVANVLFSR